MSDHAYGARPLEVASATDVTGAEEVVFIIVVPGPDACDQVMGMLLADDFFPRSVEDAVALLVTELVANAEHHTNEGVDPAVRIELRRWTDFVRVEVSGEGTVFTVDGPGLVLVDQIAGRWGVAPPTSETSTWFEVRTSDEPMARSIEPTRLGRILRRASANATRC